MAQVWPRHLSAWKVAVVVVVVGLLFVAMHGLGHRWSTKTCNICSLMAA
ncbi:MAG: hypothetical protein M0010_15265 [Actinomycetota bacterium]|jgi:isoprenylcysteine carboxyl methyltransferase (ICMT) family protein YpbQ|nr:hypothetical protein [Actinomycetota bacterium]